MQWNVIILSSVTMSQSEVHKEIIFLWKTRLSIVENLQDELECFQARLGDLVAHILLTIYLYLMFYLPFVVFCSFLGLRLEGEWQISVLLKGDDLILPIMFPTLYSKYYSTTLVLILFLHTYYRKKNGNTLQCGWIWCKV